MVRSNLTAHLTQRSSSTTLTIFALLFLAGPSSRVIKPETQTNITRIMLLETHEPPPKVDPELESNLRQIYGQRTNKILSAIQAIPTRYYLRINTLKTDQESLVESMVSRGFDAHLDESLDDAAFLRPHPSDLEINGTIVEANRMAAEAVQLGSHLYAPGVRKCHGLLPGMKVTVVDDNGTPVGSGVSRQSETSILTYRQGIAVEIEQCRTGLPSIMETPWYQRGEIHLQSLPAILTSHVLDPRSEETIVDLNCAPGGKMSHICQLSRNQASVIGFDRNTGKIQKAKELLQRMSCSNYQLIPHDSRYVHPDYNIKADKVLVDPPCSALGIGPKLSITTTAQDVENSAKYQKQFLTGASHITRTGGTIVYSVCTITKGECEDVVEFGDRELELELDDQVSMLGEPGFDPSHLTQRFSPDKHETGYFIARFRKN
jgi:16S rRNA C967 or C1407 C5-methylase (RsmB/RsmF family)